MSYIPDFRNETEKMNDRDKEYILGYRCAMEDAKSFFDNIDDYFEDMDESDEEEIEKIKKAFEEYMDLEEIDTVCSIFEGDEYEDVELVDANEPLFKGTKGAKLNGKG